MSTSQILLEKHWREHTVDHHTSETVTDFAAFIGLGSNNRVNLQKYRKSNPNIRQMSPNLSLEEKESVIGKIWKCTFPPVPSRSSTRICTVWIILFSVPLELFHRGKASSAVSPRDEQVSSSMIIYLMTAISRQWLTMGYVPGVWVLGEWE